MVLLAITTETWIVTGLGFGIVLALLFCLVFIIEGLGWAMQKITAPKASKTEQVAPTQATKAETPANDEADLAAVAMALYLYKGASHDIPTAMISLHKHETAWNEKSIGLNNKGF